MANKGRKSWMAGVLVLVVLNGVGQVTAHGQTAGAVDTPPVPTNTRVRADDPALSVLIRQALDQSATFRGLVDAIQATDGIVYVIRGRCGHYVRACLLLWTAAAGPNRLLRVVIDNSRQSDTETMASLGHELRHALEVLAEPSVRTGDGMFSLYKRNGAVQGETFETKAAIKVGNAVYNELKRRRKD